MIMKNKAIKICIAAIIVSALLTAFAGCKYTSKEEMESSREESSAPVKLRHYSVRLSSGHYISGMDIPAGTYTIEAVKGNGNVYSTNVFKGGLNEIMGTDNGSTKTFDNAELPAGEILSVLNVTVKIESDAANVSGMKKRDNPAKVSKTLKPGNYTAGTDFDAGTYDVKAAEGSGNVYSSNTDRGINAIMGTKADDEYIKEFKGVLLESGTAITVTGVTVHLNPSK
jgi:hypothetical protein